MPENKNWRAPRKDNTFQTPIAPNAQQSNLPRMSLGSARLSIGANHSSFGRQSLGPASISNDFATMGIAADQPRHSFGGNRQSIENRSSLRRYLTFNRC